MRVAVIHHNPASRERWRDALARELPEAEVSIWKEGGGAGFQYAIGWAAPPSTFFTEQRQLKAFFSTGAGVEKILADDSTPMALPVIRLEDAGMGAQMATYCVSEALAWMRRRDDYASQQQARMWRQLPGEVIADWPVGVFGLGVLGRQVAAAFAGLGFSVNGFARSTHTASQIRCFSESGGAGDFAAFMQATRVLIILAPLTPATRNIFDHATLALLPAGSYVVNVARGGLLVEDALLDLLNADHLAGAALDVFRQEPLPHNHPFWTHPKIRMTPHISAMTMIDPSARQVAEKIRRLERGEAVSGLVDRTRGY